MTCAVKSLKTQMNKVTPLILLTGVLSLTACSETANSNSKTQVSTPTTSLGTTSDVEPKAIPAIVVEEPKQVVIEEPKQVVQVVTKPAPAVKSSFTVSAKQQIRFINFDANGDGGVTESEYAAALRRHFENTSSNKDASEIASNRLRKFDLNSDGSLSAKEFSMQAK